MEGRGMVRRLAEQMGNGNMKWLLGFVTILLSVGGGFYKFGKVESSVDGVQMTAMENRVVNAEDHKDIRSSVENQRNELRTSVQLLLTEQHKQALILTRIADKVGVSNTVN